MFVLHRMRFGLLNGEGPTPVESGVVMVGAVGEAVLAGSLIPRLLVGQPLVRLVAPDDGWTVRAVEVVREVGVRFHAAEERDELLKAPLVVAPGCPVVVVFRHAAQEDLRVDGGTSRP